MGSRGWVPVVTGTTVVGGWFLYAAPGRAGFKPAPTGAVIGDGFPPRIEYGAGSSASSGQAPSAEGGVMGGRFLLAGIGLKAGMGDC